MASPVANESREAAFAQLGTLNFMPTWSACDITASTTTSHGLPVRQNPTLVMVNSRRVAVWCCTGQDATSRQREGRLRLPGLTGLHNHLADLVRFELACLKTWLVRRSGASADSGMNLHVPCVRHVMDVRPCNLLVMLYVLTLSSTVRRSECSSPAQPHHGLYSPESVMVLVTMITALSGRLPADRPDTRGWIMLPLTH